MDEVVTTEASRGYLIKFVDIRLTVKFARPTSTGCILAILVQGTVKSVNLLKAGGSNWVRIFQLGMTIKIKALPPTVQVQL